MLKPEDLGGTAMFKTQKILGSRALITDSWSRCFASTTGTEMLGDDPRYSHASLGHGKGEGYNALYGDGSARRFGDPQKHIRYWPWLTTNTYGSWKEMTTTATKTGGLLYATYWCSGRDDRPGTGNKWDCTYAGYANVAVWHEFDKDMDIDVGTTGPWGE